MQQYISELFKGDGSQLGSAERKAFEAAKKIEANLQKLNEQHTKLSQQLEQTKNALNASQGALDANISLLISMEQERREAMATAKEDAEAAADSKAEVAA